jgi:hypothetical protein
MLYLPMSEFLPLPGNWEGESMPSLKNSVCLGKISTAEYSGSGRHHLTKGSTNIYM